MSAPPVELRDVAKAFAQGGNRIRALDGVSLRVRPGEWVAIMGASGSGKSTLLHAVAGLTGIDAGEVRIDGQDLAGLRDAALTRFRRERIGLVFQALNLIPTLDARANVELPVRAAAGRARATALLERMGLGARLHHKPDALSGGEQQRVAIARALVNEPALVLADEPTGSLDSDSGQELCRLLRDLADEGRTLLVVTHEPSVAMWADRVVVLRDGRLLDEFAVPAGRDAEALAARYQQALARPAAAAAEPPRA